jgi:hypothetical protein
MDNKELKSLWKKYIDLNVYRTISTEHINDILKNGLDPSFKPYKEVKNNIKNLFRLLNKLKNQNYKYKEYWGNKVIYGDELAIICLEDLNSSFIDFTFNYKEIINFKRLRGGTLTKVIRRITQDLLDKDLIFNIKEKKLINNLYDWSKLKEKNFHNKIIYIKGSSSFFEKALFQTNIGKKGKNKYCTSAFGSFNHFKKVITKYGFLKYKSYLTNKKRSFLRIKHKIPANEIIKII